MCPTESGWWKGFIEFRTRRTGRKLWLHHLPARKPCASHFLFWNLSASQSSGSPHRPAGCKGLSASQLFYLEAEMRRWGEGNREGGCITVSLPQGTAPSVGAWFHWALPEVCRIPLKVAYPKDRNHYPLAPVLFRWSRVSFRGVTSHTFRLCWHVA